MAVDKLVDSSQLDSDLTSVANAIRAKSGGSGQLAFPAGFVSEIGNIPSGGGGGLPAGLAVLKDITLSENVRAVQLDIPAGYESVYVVVKGEFASATWLYWGLNVTNAGNYCQKETQISRAFFAQVITTYSYLVTERYNGAAYIFSDNSKAFNYVHLRGYDKDFKAGTRFVMIGGKYADM